MTTTTITLSDLNKMLENVLELKGVTIEGDIEIEFEGGGTDQELMQVAGYEIVQIAARLNNIAGMVCDASVHYYL